MRATSDPSGEQLVSVVIVAFDPATGQILGTSTQSGFGEIDRRYVERDHDRLISVITQRPCDAHPNPQTIEVPGAVFTSGVVDRVDPATGILIFDPRTVDEIVSCGPTFESGGNAAR